jgi:excinuclease ABC subunit B
MYADHITDSMQKAIDETNRRRHIQEEYNKLHNITPTTIKKEIGESISIEKDGTNENVNDIISVDIYNKMTKLEQKDVIESLEQQMREAAKDLKFEEAMSLRDIIFELKAGENKWKTKKQK